jgi:hypothetical protein
MLPTAKPARRPVPLPPRGPDAPPLRKRLLSLPSMNPFARSDPPPSEPVLRRADTWTPPTDTEPLPAPGSVDLDSLTDHPSPPETGPDGD